MAACSVLSETSAMFTHLLTELQNLRTRARVSAPAVLFHLSLSFRGMHIGSVPNPDTHYIVRTTLGMGAISLLHKN